MLNEKDGKLRGFDAGLAQLITRYILGDGAKYQFRQVNSSTRGSRSSSTTRWTWSLRPTPSPPPALKKLRLPGAVLHLASRGAGQGGNTAIQSHQDLAGKKVATQAGSTGPSILAQYAPRAAVQEFQTHQEALDALRQRRVDAYVTDHTLLLNALSLGTSDAKLAGAPFGAPDHYGIGLPKGARMKWPSSTPS